MLFGVKAPPVMYLEVALFFVNITKEKKKEEKKRKSNCMIIIFNET